jgi:hypothetical protein
MVSSNGKGDLARAGLDAATMNRKNDILTLRIVSGLNLLPSRLLCIVYRAGLTLPPGNVVAGIRN